jgi:uncharacterized protein
LSRANVDEAKALYEFLNGLAIEHIQFIPLAEFDRNGAPSPFTITAEQQYGLFLVELFDVWCADRRKMHIRLFDNFAEGAAGQKPSTCTMHETCDSDVVVEYNGDIFPCDFFAERNWKLRNILSIPGAQSSGSRAAPSLPQTRRWLAPNTWRASTNPSVMAGAAWLHEKGPPAEVPDRPAPPI